MTPQSVCNFCLKRAEIAAAANAVAMCHKCLIDAFVTMGKEQPVWWGVMVVQIIQSCAPQDAEPLVEPMARAAVKFFAGNVGLLQSCGEALAQRDTTAFWRGAAIMLGAIQPALMTALDARRAIYAALFVGDFERAATIEPARTAEKADRSLRSHQLVVGLLRAAPGSPEARALRERAVELARDKPGSDVERMIVAMGEAFAHVRAGDAARGLAAYKPFRDDPGLRPWHSLAIGDALAITGDATGARDVWNRVADQTGWEPYWPARARERLGGTTPYR